MNLYIEDRDQPFIFFGFDREKELWKCGSKSNIDSVDDAVANVGGTSNPDDYMTVRDTVYGYIFNFIIFLVFSISHEIEKV